MQGSGFRIQGSDLVPVSTPNHGHLSTPQVCSSIVVAVEYRLAPEHRCPAAYDDGYEVLQWLARQAVLISNDTAAREGDGSEGGERREISRGPLHSEVVDTWLDTHADVSRLGGGEGEGM